MLPIYYINLDTDSQRRASMQAQLGLLGLQAQRVPALRWSVLSLSEQNRLYSADLNDRRFYRPMVDGEKGCYASHLKVCECLLASDASGCVVLEDDVRLSPDFPAVVEALGRLEGGWDVIKLHSRPMERAHLELALCPGHALVTYWRVPSWATGYAISRAGAEKMLKFRQPFGRPVDVDVRCWWEAGLRVCGVLPGVVTLGGDADHSSIWSPQEKTVSDDRWRKWRFQVVYSVRNAIYRRRQTLPKAWKVVPLLQKEPPCAS
jgi:glycosyl transferase family 25